ncbi:MAG: hydroxyacid dehydrogenase [Oscillospiraceae bacterium]|nr:hydroxyacid dehydrogenase [Oscillospiraceae bacterium]
MKILIVGSRDRYEKFLPEKIRSGDFQLVFAPRGSSNEHLLELAADADVILADAISPVDRTLMESMPNLKMVHSEGVAYNAIDVETAHERGIFVCNNRGCNADAVAEQTLMLMLMLLRRGEPGHRAVREGRQIQYKEQAMSDGITELGDCTVGLIGLGDIAQSTARVLRAFGCNVYYYAPHRRAPSAEMAMSVSYLPLDKLIAKCDIISLHCPVNDETRHMVNDQFLSRMKPTAYLINTGRGDLVDNEALRAALVEGRIAGAGLDTIAPEPTPADHPLVDLPEEVRDRVVYSPHLGGITTGSFQRAHQNMWSSVLALSQGKRPNHIVNGL